MFNHGWIGNYSYHRARLTPDKEAIFDLDAEKGYTYKELDNRANIMANYLVKELGCKKGDRIAFLSRNRIELFDAYYATAKNGAILVPYNVRLTAEELQELIKNENPLVLFYEDVFADKVSKLKENTDIKKYVALDNKKVDSADLNYSEIINYADNSPYSEAELDFEDTHLLIHTGGTTGLPKGAKLSHRAMLFNSLNEVLSWDISAADSAHLILPLFHTGGWNLLTLPLLHAGGRLLINKQFDPAQALKVIEEEKTTLVFGAATIFQMLAELPEFEECDLSSVRWMMAGAAPTPKNIMAKYWEKGVKFVLGYGMTEAGPNNLSVAADSLNFSKIKEKYASVGKPMYFSEAKIVDSEGKEVDIGEAGELIWSGPQIFSGYWNNKEETDKTLKDGWVYSGDMAIKDEEGYYYIVGRKKNMFISGGENVFPPKIEKIIYDLPEVKEVIVIGVADDRWGEVGKAVICLHDDCNLSQDDIKNFLEDKLAKFKIPKYIEFVDSLPKNDVGKLLRSKVEKLYG